MGQEQGKIKGTVLISRMEFIRSRFGEETLQKVISELPAESGAVLKGILLPSGWYPFEANHHLDEVLIKMLGGGAEEAFRSLGRESAEYNLKKFQAMFLKGKDAHSFLAQAPSIYRMYYDVGTHTYEKISEQSARLVTRGALNVAAGECLTVCGWYERALEELGAESPAVRHPKCVVRGDECCQYDVNWS